MKVVLKVILLILFGAAVFMPMRGIPFYLYWMLFVLMFLTLFLYYYVAYYVGKKHVAQATRYYSMFVAMVPPMTSEDLIRGRLVVEPTQLALYQKQGRTITQVWSISIDDLQSFSVGKVIGARKGVTFTLECGEEVSFAISQIKKKQVHLKTALGWD